MTTRVAHRSGVGDWILRLALLIVVAAAVWYGFRHLPYPLAETRGRPFLYGHRGYEGSPDERLDHSQIQALQERVHTQNY